MYVAIDLKRWKFNEFYCFLYNIWLKQKKNKTQDRPQNMVFFTLKTIAKRKEKRRRKLWQGEKKKRQGEIERKKFNKWAFHQNYWEIEKRNRDAHGIFGPVPNLRPRKDFSSEKFIWIFQKSGSIALWAYLLFAWLFF